MWLKMTVEYDGQEVRFDMPVGDGNKTFKWLGLAAAQRFSTMVKPHGSRRHREKKGPKGLHTISAKLLPSRVSTNEAPFCHPEKIISTELDDGHAVCVTLSSKMPVNPIGKPDGDRWMFIAFSISDPMESKREDVLQEEQRCVCSIRKRTEDELAAKMAGVAAKKGGEMRHIISSQLYSSDKVERAFTEDWDKLTGPPLHPLNNITQDTEEQAKIKGVIFNHYLTLVEMFATYASVGSGAATGHMDLMEFSAFMHDLRGPQIPKSRDVVEKTFNEALGVRKGTQGKSSSMEANDFVYAIIKLACVRHQVPGHTVGEQSSNKFRIGGESGIGRIKATDWPNEAVLMFMEDVLVPLGRRKVIGLQIKRALDTDEVLSLFFDYHPSLWAVFNHYSKSVAERDAVITDLLNIAEFSMLLKDAKLLGGNKDDEELTVMEARQAFAGAQNALCGEEDEHHSLAPGGAAVEQMTYPEFLEGVARVAVLKWEDMSTPIIEKMGWALKCVASLPAASQATNE
ncbi:unnamed protein product [Discosporangium mesarthrocarpum]